MPQLGGLLRTADVVRLSYLPTIRHVPTFPVWHPLNKLLSDMYPRPFEVGEVARPGKIEHGSLQYFASLASTRMLLADDPARPPQKGDERHRAVGTGIVADRVPRQSPSGLSSGFQIGSDILPEDHVCLSSKH